VKDIEKIKSSISPIISLNNDDWLILLDHIEIKTLKKNEYFLKEGQVCDSIAFINYGSLIYFKVIEEIKEITTDFAFEGNWVTDNQSRLTYSPSYMNIKAIDDTELLEIKSADLDVLYTRIPKLEKLGRLLMENAFLKITQLSIDLQVLTATERYIKLLNTHPEIFQRVSQYHIANYLGIAPKSLSRIRNEISQPE
jgi:CRP-like cAMP-binding protein